MPTWWLLRNYRHQKTTGQMQASVTSHHGGKLIALRFFIPLHFLKVIREFGGVRQRVLKTMCLQLSCFCFQEKYFDYLKRRIR